MSKTLLQLTAADALDGTEQTLIDQGGNPRRALVGAPRANAFALNIMDFIPQSQRAAIQNYTVASAFDCYSAIIAAIAALPAGTNEYGGQLQFPPGYYYVSQTIQLKKGVQFVGAGGLSRVTILTWPANTSGIVVNDADTDNNAIEFPATTTAGGSRFKGISFEGNGAAVGNTTGIGLRMRARAYIEDCKFDSWAEDGVQINASVGGDNSSRGNANNWSIRDVVASNNGGNGLLVYGTDVNAGCAMGFSASSNGTWGVGAAGGDAWGIYDASFLGNTYVGCHAEFNKSGPYRATNENARTVFLGCYSEQDASTGSEIIAPALVIGGIHAAGFKSTTTGVVFIGKSFGSSDLNITNLGPAGRTITLGLNQNGAGLTLSVSGETGGETTQLAWWHDASGNWVDQSGYGDNQFNAGSSVIIRTTSLTQTVDLDRATVPPGQIIFPQQYWVNLGVGFAKQVIVTYAAAAPSGPAPTGADWAVGNIVYNTAPTAGGFIGWVCTAAGTPGTWKTFGAVAA